MGPSAVDRFGIRRLSSPQLVRVAAAFVSFLLAFQYKLGEAAAGFSAIDAKSAFDVL